MMLKDSINVFSQVLDLAEKRRLSEPNEDVIINFSEFDLDDLAESEEEHNLRVYLESLDYETVKTIMVIMYLGRDRDYKRNDPPEEILRQQKEYFDLLGWSGEKEIEVDQMVGKIPLGEYLRTGLNILNIDI